MPADTPEDLALLGFGPESRVRILGSATSGHHAAVLVETPEWGGYRYLVSAVRDAGTWHESGSDNSDCQWDGDDDLGVLRAWRDDGGDASVAEVRYGGKAVKVPVCDGVYVFVMEEVPAPNFEFNPVVTLIP